MGVTQCNHSKTVISTNPTGSHNRDLHGTTFIQIPKCDAAYPIDPEIIAQVLGAACINAASLAGRISEDAVQNKLNANTEEAVARGVFGAPNS